MTIILSILLAAILGFAAHRAGMCSVRAVGEILTTRRSLMLQSFIKASLWVIGIAVPLAWLSLTPPHSIAVFALAWSALLGGFVFGMGAAFNGGCAFFTLSRLVSGELKLLFTLLGFVLGFVLHSQLFPAFHSPPAAPLLAVYQRFESPYLLLLLPVWGWMAYEWWRLWVSRPVGMTWMQRLLADQYRLSTGAFLFGVSNAVLISIWGGWSYTGTLYGLVTHPVTGSVDVTRLLLFAALLGGMVFSALQRRSVRWRFDSPRQWLVHLLSGALMGLGIAMTPGGNTGLLLEGIPMLSPHAIPAYLAMMVGVAAVLLLKMALFKKPMNVDCRGDVVQTDNTHL